ncbi:hypothetical protein H4Q26_015632 [Puccinia striiformis f. sp. tritici PST-130]|nr:hypothetical protein H4Q26_015632 [Puccinia striiformis f. sp. tritici PST-130]
MQISRLTIMASIFGNLACLEAAFIRTADCEAWKTPQQHTYLRGWVSDEEFHRTWRNSLLYSPNNQNFEIPHMDASPARRLKVSHDPNLGGYMRLTNTGTQRLRYMVQDSSTGKWLVDEELKPGEFNLVQTRTALVFLKAY